MVSFRKLVPFSIRLKVEVEVNKSLSKGSRIVEVPFTIGNIDLSHPCKVLVFGSFNDIVSIELASMGFLVTGFDLAQEVFYHPNLKVVHGDFLETSVAYESESFDLAYALSAIEHVGLEVYGQSPSGRGDKDVVEEIWRLLKPNGRFIITVPFGQKGQYPKKSPTYRKYDLKSMNDLLSHFTSFSIKCYGCDAKLNWFPTSPEELEKNDGSDVPKGVACIVAHKLG